MRKIRLKSTGTDRLALHLDRDLNDAQRAAATAPDGYNLILAGPGSGKTRVITYRVAHLIARGVPASSILLVTFTRRAAREIAIKNKEHKADTEDLRHALIYYRSLFDELLKADTVVPETN